MKTCCTCRAVKAITEFSKSARRKDGLYPRCKGCCRSYYERNRDRISKIHSEYREQNRESALTYARSYYAENREEMNRRSRMNYEQNRERYAEQHAQYRDRNREEILTKKREYSRSVAGQVNARMQCDNSLAISRATHHGLPWAPAEDVLIIRDDLTEKEKAFALCRSIYSVRSRRKKLRKNGVLA